MYRSTISDTDGQKVKEVLDRTRLAVMKTASQVVLGVLAAHFCMMRRDVGGAISFFSCAIVLSAGHVCERLCCDAENGTGSSGGSEDRSADKAMQRQNNLREKTHHDGIWRGRCCEAESYSAERSGDCRCLFVQICAVFLQMCAGGAFKRFVL